MRELLNKVPAEAILVIVSIAICVALPTWQTISLAILVLFLCYLAVKRLNTINDMHRDYNEISDKYIDVNSDRENLLEEQAEWKKANADYVKLVGELTQKVEQLNSDNTDLTDKLNAVVAQHKTEAEELETQLKDTTEKATQAIQTLLNDVQTLKKSVHEIDLTCAYCNTIQPVLFDIAAGEFVCKKCSNTNAIHTNIFTARTNTLLK